MSQHTDDALQQTNADALNTDVIPWGTGKTYRLAWYALRAIEVILLLLILPKAANYFFKTPLPAYLSNELVFYVLLDMALIIGCAPRPKFTRKELRNSLMWAVCLIGFMIIGYFVLPALFPGVYTWYF